MQEALANNESPSFERITPEMILNTEPKIKEMFRISVKKNSTTTIFQRISTCGNYAFLSTRFKLTNSTKQIYENIFDNKPFGEDLSGDYNRYPLGLTVTENVTSSENGREVALTFKNIDTLPICFATFRIFSNVLILKNQYIYINIAENNPHPGHERNKSISRV